MNRDDFVKDILHDGDTRFPAALLRGLLAPLARLHQIGLEAYLLPYNIGLRKQTHLPVPVVAIGNLSSGGTGKTPMAALVASHLQTNRRVALLSRGHGGQNESKDTARVVSDGKTVLLAPDLAGDEPVLLAHRLPGVSVLVGRDRRVSGKMACDLFSPDVLLCDDALQFWQLFRDINIVLLDAQAPWDNGFVLPRGLLREPPRHIARAHIVVLTRADRASQAQIRETKAQIARYAPDAAVFCATHAPQSWVQISGELGSGSGESAQTELPLFQLHAARAFVFSGIADHQAFAQSVRAQGINQTGERSFPDHHAYTEANLLELIAAAKKSNADVLVTTEKDAVKIAPLLAAAQNPLPTYALRVAMKIDHEAAFFARIDELLP